MAHRAHPYRSKLASNLNSTPLSSPQISQNTCEQRRKRHSPNREVGNQRNKRQREPNKEDVHRRNKRNRSRNQLLTSDPEDLEVEESPHNREDSDEDWHDEEENQQILPRYRSFQKCQHIVTYMAKQKYTISNFLEDYCTKLFTCAKKGEGDAHFQAAHHLGVRKRHIAQALSSSIVQETVNNARSGRIKIVQSSDLSGWATKQLIDQLDCLVGKHPFCDDPASQSTLAGPKPLVDKC